MIDVGPVKFPWGLAARSVTGIFDIDKICILVLGLGYHLLALGSLCLAPRYSGPVHVKTWYGQGYMLVTGLFHSFSIFLH